MRDELKHRVTTLDSFTYGIRRFCYGLAKKVLIADILGQTVDIIFTAASSQQIDMPTAWLGMICYTLQIYFDFSGYTDMAIGLGKMLGLSTMENFNYPYISRSVTEFWRRWHISLSSWFRNYLYIPMGEIVMAMFIFIYLWFFCSRGYGMVQTGLSLSGD